MQTALEVYNLFEFTKLDDIFTPVKNTARVKYTCFDVCEQLLVFGANSGSLYLFMRKPLQFLRVLPNKEGPLTIVCISPNGRYVAFATSKGAVIVLELKISTIQTRRLSVPLTPPKCMNKSSNHLGVEVTSLQWSDGSEHLFVADATGKVTSMKITSKKARTLFQVSSSMIAQLDSRVVQMDFAQGKLLISSLTSCFLCDTTKEQYSQIGTKPRDGEFGACFYSNLNSQTPTIYTARPGSRLWEVDFEGCVLCTHQFKQELTKTALYAVPICKDAATLASQPDVIIKSCNFPRLIVIQKRFLLTWMKEKLVLFDPISVRVLLWTIFSYEILDVRSYANELYIWRSDGNLQNFYLLTVDCGICRLLSENDERCWKLGATLCCTYENVIIRAHSRNWLPRRLLSELAVHLKKYGEVELGDRIDRVIDQLEELPMAKPVANDCNEVPSKYHVESGIYVVHRPNGTGLENLKMISKMANGLVKSATSKAEGCLKSESKRLQHNFVETKSVDGYQQTRGSVSNNFPIKKTVSTSDMQMYEEKSQSLKRGQSLSEVYRYQSVHALLPFTSAYFWDLDPAYGYEALATLNPGAAFDGLKSSLSSTYQSGKETILSKFGVLEDHLKSISVEDPLDLLDVNNGHHFTDAESQESDYLTEDSVIYLKGNNQDRRVVNCIKRSTPLISDLDLSALLHASQLTLNYLSSSDITVHLDSWADVLIDTQEMMYCKLYHIKQHTNSKSPTPNSLKRSKSCGASLYELEQLGFTSLTHDIQGHSYARRNSCPYPSNTISANVMNETIIDASTKNAENGILASLSIEDVFWWQEFRLKDGGIEDTIIGNIAECVLCCPNIFIHDPWGLNFDDHKVISELAMLCFKNKTFGRIKSYSSQLACLTRIDDLEMSSADCFETIRRDWCEDCDNAVDHSRSVFVRQFFHLLKPVEVFHELHKEEAFTFLTWRTIIKGLTQLIVEECTPELKCFSLLLSSIGSEATPEIVEKLSESDFISPRDVLYADWLQSSSKTGLFIKYMNVMCKAQLSELTQKSSRMYCSESFLNTEISKIDFCKDPIVHIAWLMEMIQENRISSAEEMKCHCGMPRAGSHLYPWKQKDKMLQILKLNIKTKARCLELCKKYGFWLGYLQLSNNFISRKDVFSLLVQLGDINLLKDSFSVAYLPQTVDEWQTFLQLMIAQRENGDIQCLFCRSQLLKYSSSDEFTLEKDVLAFEDVAHVLLKVCAADIVLKLIAEVTDTLPHVRMSSAFYRCCVANSLLQQRRQRSHAYKISDNMDSYVWSHHKNYAYPQVRSSLLSEIKKMGSKTLLQTTEHCCYLEDLRCHWGVTLDPSSACDSCSLPLVVQVTSSDESRIRIFPCGHAYHSQCTQDRCCPVCQ